MILDGKLKRVVLLVAVDICLRNVSNPPKRRARYLIELGISAYPNKISQEEKNILYQDLLTFFENDDIPAARALFSSVFLY
jgi:hypothetical protein